MSAMASEFESGVDCRAEMVGVGVAETGTQVVAEPTVDLVGSPKPVAAPGVGDGGREASWTSFTVDEKPHALTCSTGPSCNVGHGDEPGAGKTGDPNSFDGLKLRDRSTRPPNTLISTPKKRERRAKMTRQYFSVVPLARAP